MSLTPTVFIPLLLAAEPAGQLVADTPLEVARSPHPFRGACAARNGGALAVVWAASKEGVLVRRMDGPPLQLAKSGDLAVIVPAQDGFFAIWTTKEGQRWSGKTEVGLRLDAEAKPLEQARTVRPQGDDAAREWADSFLMATADSLIAGSNYTYDDSELWRARFTPKTPSERLAVRDCVKDAFRVTGLSAEAGWLHARLEPDDRVEDSKHWKPRDCKLQIPANVAITVSRPGLSGYFWLGGRWRDARQGFDILHVPYRGGLAQAKVSTPSRRGVELTLLDASGKTSVSIVSLPDVAGKVDLHCLSASDDELWLVWSESGRDARLRAVRAWLAPASKP